MSEGDHRDSMYQCLVCEDWIHNQCLFGSHADDNTAPLGEDDFDMIICERCVKGNAGVRIIAERYAGREGTGVMIVEEGGKVRGVTKAFEEGKDEGLGDLGEGSEGEVERISNEVGGASGAEQEETGNETKRKLEGMVDDEEEPTAKKSKPNTGETSFSAGGGDPSTSSSSSSSSSTLPSSSHTNLSSSAASSIPTTASSTLASSTSSRTCHAPPALPSSETPLTELERNGGRLNLFLGNEWMDNWCRCQEVRRIEILLSLRWALADW